MRGGEAEDWKTGAFHRNLLLEFKDAARDCTPASHREEILNNKYPPALRLILALECICFHGVRRTSFHGIVPFWGLLEKLRFVEPTNKILTRYVKQLSASDLLCSPLSRARGFLRMALNEGTLRDLIAHIATQTNWLTQYYQPGALLLNTDSVNILLAIISSLKVFKFSLEVEEDAQGLNRIPVSLRYQLDMYASGEVQPMVRRASISHSAAVASESLSSVNGNSGKNNSQSYSNTTNGNLSSNSIGSGYYIESFLRSVENKFDRLINSVDQIISDSLLDENGHELEFPSLPLFGTPLQTLIQDETRCGCAYLNPALGIPRQIHRLMKMMVRNANHPHILTTPANSRYVSELVRYLEADYTSPRLACCAHVGSVRHVLIAWLLQLPEPLCGYQHFDALIAASELDDPAHRIANLRVILQDTPWYCKALLVRVLRWMSALVAPENLASNNASFDEVVSLFTPILIRPSLNVPFETLSFESQEEARLRASAISSCAVGFLLRHLTEVCGPLFNEYDNGKHTLKAKCKYVGSLLDALATGIIVGDSSDSSTNTTSDSNKVVTSVDLTPELTVALYDRLALSESKLAINSSASSTTSDSPVQKDIGTRFELVVVSKRWEICGFVMNTPQHPTLRGLQAAEHGQSISDPQQTIVDTMQGYSTGMLSVKFLTSFLETYDDRAAGIVQDTMLNRRLFCSILDISNFVTELISESLHLIGNLDEYRASRKNNGTGTVLSIAEVAKASSWVLLSDERAVQALYDVGFLCFDEMWRNFTERLGEEPSNDTYGSVCRKTRGIIHVLVNRQPKTVSQLWNLWATLRLRQEEKANALRRTPQQRIRSYSTASIYDDFDSSPLPAPPAAITTSTPNLENPRTRANSVSIETGTSPPSSGLFNIINDKSNNTCVQVDVNEFTNAQEALRAAERESSALSSKEYMGVKTHIIGTSTILSDRHVSQLEAALPKTHQCYDWKLLYRMALHGASLMTLIEKCKGFTSLLLVLQDESGAVFGALLTEQLKFTEQGKYYGTGSMGVFTFVGGSLRYFPWSYKNSYFLLSTRESLAVGGGGSFAIYLDSDLNVGCSGDCATFNSPMLSTSSEFQCYACEVYALVPPNTSL